MASDLNIVNLVGRLTKDSELKYTNSGFQITTFTLASSRSVKKNDQWEEESNFFDCKLLGKRGETLSQYLKKGTQMAISAELVQERWEQEGQKRSKIVLIVNNIQLLGGNKKEAQQDNNQSQNRFQDDIPW